MVKRFLARKDRDRVRERDTEGITPSYDYDQDDAHAVTPPSMAGCAITTGKPQRTLLPASGAVTTVKPHAGRVLPRPQTLTEGHSLLEISPPLTSAAGAQGRLQGPAIRRQTSISDMSMSSATGSVASSKAPSVASNTTTSTTALPRPRTYSTASVSSGLPGPRRVSASQNDLPVLMAPRSRTTSFTSPANVSFTKSPGKPRVAAHGSRVPVSASAYRRLGSIQTNRALGSCADSTPRPAYQTASLSSKGRLHAHYAEDSPGLEVLVANTTLQMQDIQDMLSPLAPVTNRDQVREARREGGSWVSIESSGKSASRTVDSQEEEEEELENVPSPTKSRRLAQPPRAVPRVKGSTLSGMILPVPGQQGQPSLSREGLPLPPTSHKSSARQPTSKLVAPSPRPHTASSSQIRPDAKIKASSDVHDILSALEDGVGTSPSKLLASDISTQAMALDLSLVALTPLKPPTTASFLQRSTENMHARAERERLEAELAKAQAEHARLAEESALEQRQLRSRAEKDNKALQAEVREVNEELAKLRAMIARQAAEASKVSQLDFQSLKQKTEQETMARLEAQLKEARLATTAIREQISVQAAQAKWAFLGKAYEWEIDVVGSQLQTIGSLKAVLANWEVQISVGS